MPVIAGTLLAVAERNKEGERTQHLGEWDPECGSGAHYEIVPGLDIVFFCLFDYGQ